MHNWVKRTKVTTRPRLRDIFSKTPGRLRVVSTREFFLCLLHWPWEFEKLRIRGQDINSLCLCVPRWGLAKQNYKNVFEITVDRVENQTVPDYCELRRSTGGWFSFPGRLIIVHFNKSTLDWKKRWIWNGTSRTSQTMYGVVRPLLPVVILCFLFQMIFHLFHNK